MDYSVEGTRCAGEGLVEGAKGSIGVLEGVASWGFGELRAPISSTVTRTILVYTYQRIWRQL